MENHQPKTIHYRAKSACRSEKVLSLLGRTLEISAVVPSAAATRKISLRSKRANVAQILEQLRDNRLYRPLTKYVGPQELMPVPPLNER